MPSQMHFRAVSRFAVILAGSCVVLALALPSAGPAEDTKNSQIPSGRFVGNVAETMNAGGYTYVRLERAGEGVWAAAPTTVVEVGEEYAVSLDLVMPDFRSATEPREGATASGRPRPAPPPALPRPPRAGPRRSAPRRPG